MAAWVHIKGQFREHAWDIAGAVVVTVVAAVSSFVMAPRERVLDPSDPTIQWPMADPETVSNAMLVVIGVLLPLVLLIPLSFATRRGGTPDLFVSLLGLWIALVLTMAITDIVKNYVGRLRPDFMDRCQYDPTSQLCTGDPEVIEEGRKSFPSGHASISFAGLGYLSFYWAGAIDAFRGKPRAWKLIIFLTPIFGASLVALSRFNDYRHHWQDILAGGVLGLTLAILSYRMYFPSLIRPRPDDEYHPSASGDSRL